MTRPALTDPIDLRLDPDAWDLLVSNGDLSFVSGLDAVAQGVRFVVQLFFGEWFANRAAGVRWLANDLVSPEQAILGQKFNAVKARAELRREILLVPGVAEVVSLDVSFDRTTRTVRASWEVRSVYSTTETISDSLERAA